MKHLQALLVGLIVVAVTTSIGCVYSLRPWFGEDAQVLDDRLLGEWLNVEEDGSVDDDVVVVEQTSWNTYRVSEWGVCALAHIGGRHYFDCDQSGTEDLLEPWELPCHSLFLITVKKDKVMLRLLDPEKVEKFLRDEIGFVDIVSTVEKTLEMHEAVAIESLEEALDWDRWGREQAREILVRP